jgi:hypothetical protein
MTVVENVATRSHQDSVRVDRSLAIRRIVDLAVAVDYEETVVDALLTLGATENEIVAATFDLR